MHICMCLCAYIMYDVCELRVSARTMCAQIDKTFFIFSDILFCHKKKMQRRFVEVYEQISANLEETRRYYTKAQILKKYHC